MEKFLLWVGAGVIRLLDWYCDVFGCNDYIEAFFGMLMIIFITTGLISLTLMKVGVVVRNWLHFLLLCVGAVLLVFAWACSTSYKKPLNGATLMKAYTLLEKRSDERKSRRRAILKVN